MRQAVRPESTTIKAESSAPFNRLCHNYQSGFNCSNQPSHFLLNRIEVQKRLSITYDQGKKMSDHKKLTLEIGVKVYFADPLIPWQRGINENTNGLLRQYFPIGTDLNGYNQEQLDEVAWQLNIRPRKSLGFKYPAEMFTPDAFDFKQHYASLFALAS